ncbi:hypothetical protein Krhi01_01742 [Kocuria rhizophila]|uniref:DUF4193 domain-containing protein n=2 Tax=Micrococcaceae TaxID=1268 RepID=B2GJ67_KOCRD|nr:hypothetical protein KRH_14250 [Kocuria rhizophila DC2201]
MATDYDAPRKQDEDLKEDSIEELQSRRSDHQSGSVDEDEATAAESFELPGADLSNEELSVVVLPAQDDEFTCGSCFLVRHRSQLAEERNGVKYCFECLGCRCARSGGAPQGLSSRGASARWPAPALTARASSSGCRVAVSQ